MNGSAKGGNAAAADGWHLADYWRIPCNETSDVERLCKNPLVLVQMPMFNHEPFIRKTIEGGGTQRFTQLVLFCLRNVAGVCTVWKNHFGIPGR